MKKYFLIILFSVFLIPHISFASFQGVRVYRGTPQTVGTSSITKIQFASEDYDPSNLFDSTTNYRFTAAEAGYYSVQGSVGFSSVADQVLVEIDVYKSGATLCQEAVRTTSGTASQGFPYSCVVYLDVGDYIEIFAWQTSGGNLSTIGSAGVTFLTVSKFFTDADIPAGGDTVVTFGDDTIQNFNWYFLIGLFLICCGFMINIFKK